ncbi:amidophosphoribosyltransferase [Archaeoglobus veneficus]|uniref:Amidophosphoribosyltransferase n=1 Tax=Archaeoglobus veneficus (strain DSM 11195 / SNP6) TaxID=693661 RepID=F2KMW6_ARCVS|nr:amidophosphoribosyltransferase [Archaeoglobus veneficus]AEA47242.1 amidophosphoribosyltransferase [Archaeoglobus veneficus SNP6]
MCGIVGVYCENESLTPHITYYALFSLQHRGQESAGIAVAGNSSITAHKGMGLVTQVFDERILSRMNGKASVGHVRYSTTGESRIENAQPLLVRSKVGSIAVAHNGNLVNYWGLRSGLEGEGRAFLTDSDTEIIAQLLSACLLDYDTVEALKILDSKLLGSYALTILVNDTLIAYRDPLGFRPLCIGEADFGYVIASESCAIDATGARFIRDVKPGEAVIIEDGKLEFVRISESKRRAFCVFEYIYFARPDSIIDGKSVYGVRHTIGRILAKENPVDADMVSPVPDSGTTSSIGFAQESGIQYLEALIKNRYVGRTFIMPEQRMREFSVRIKMNAVRSNVEGKKVVLVDDSIVRGTTSRKIVDMVRAAGAKEVHFRVGSPPIIAPCYFGIDMSTREELIASCRSIEEIRRTINADSLAYLSLDGLLEAVGIDENELCLACLTGKYPIPVPGEKCVR